MMTTLIGILVVGVVLVALTISKLLHICQPNEVLIFSGGKSKHEDKQIRYKPIKGGRKIKLPLFETVDRMDLTNMAINVAVSGAFSKGGIPLKRRWRGQHQDRGRRAAARKRGPAPAQ